MCDLLFCINHPYIDPNKLFNPGQHFFFKTPVYLRIELHINVFDHKSKKTFYRTSVSLEEKLQSATQ